MKRAKRDFLLLPLLLALFAALSVAAWAAPCEKHCFEPREPSELLCTGTKPVTYVCTVCGESYTEENPFRAHRFEPVVKKASWGKNGEKYDECSLCGAINLREIIFAPDTLRFADYEENGKYCHRTYNGLPIYEYTGEPILPVIRLKGHSAEEYIEGKDYTVSFRDNTGLGEATVRIRFQGEYTGMLERHFMIVPGEPKHIKVSVRDGKVTLKWKDIPGVDGYKVYFSEDKGPTKTVITKENSLVLSDARPGALHKGSIEPLFGTDWHGERGYFHFRVPEIEYTRAVCNGKEQTPELTVFADNGKPLTEDCDYTVSYLHNEDTGIATARVILTVEGSLLGGKLTDEIDVSYRIVPPKVTGLKVSAVSASSVKLTWKAALGATGYTVYRSKDGKKWTKVKTVGTTGVVIKSLAGGEKLRLRVKAHSPGGDGAVSDAIRVQTLTEPPAVTLKSPKNGTVSVSWKKVSGASGYRVYTSPNAKKWTKKAETTALHFTLKKQKRGKKLYVKVVSVNSSGKASPSGKIKKITVR